MSQSHLIVAEDLADRLGDADLRIIDCRCDLLDREAGFAQYRAGHIPGAVFADLDRDLAAPVDAHTGRHPLPEVADVERTFSRLGIDDSVFVVVYDGGNGGYAARAWWMLRWLGHEQVALLDGGMACWESLQLPLQQGIQSVQERDFRAVPRPQLVMHIDELVSNGCSASGMRLVDGRDASRFRGEQEPIDTVAGHIPGALNLPFTEALNADGTWRGPNELHHMWSEILQEGPETDFAVMCGSGVTACHLVVSALLAGFREPRVYVGSWSEWIRDEDRPVAVGTAESA